MACPEYKLKKYLDRPSPPRAANEIGCRDQVFMGNDGNHWISVPNVTGVYRWVKMSVKAPTKAPVKDPAKAKAKAPTKAPAKPKSTGKLKFRKTECLPPAYQWIVGKGCFNV